MFGATQARTGTLFGSTSAPPGGLFGQPQPPQNGQPPPANTGSTLFGLPQQQPPQQQQQQQQPPPQQSIFGGVLGPQPSLPQYAAQELHQSQNVLPQLRRAADSEFTSSLISGQREKSVQDQIKVLDSKWNHKDSPEYAFKYYFYNQVDPEKAPFYGPQHYEDHRDWEEALSKKPNVGAIPVLVRGFDEIAARIQFQNLAVTGLQTRLHEINTSLTLLKSSHDLEISSRLAEARRKHIVITQRTLALATKTQILRNRGYAMDGAEEELRKKLVALEKQTFDPVLGGRQEEIWARMSGVRERARQLQEETEKLGRNMASQQDGELLSEEEQNKVDKLLRDFDQQLEQLQIMITDAKNEYDEWEKERQPANATR